MSEEADYGIRAKDDAGQLFGEGDWSYLREHLDHPRFLSMPLGAHLSPQSFGGLGAKLTGWLLHRWRNPETPRARLAAVGRLAVGPRQAVLLVEADGARVLVGTSADGAPSFLSLPQTAGSKWLEADGTGSDSVATATIASRSFSSSKWDGSLTRALNLGTVEVPAEFRADVQNGGISELMRPSKPANALRRKPTRGRRTNVLGRVSW